MKFLGCLYRKYIKTAKMAACSLDFPFGDEFDAVLAVFRSYLYDVKTSEAVEKIATDKKILFVR